MCHQSLPHFICLPHHLYGHCAGATGDAATSIGTWVLFNTQMTTLGGQGKNKLSPLLNLKISHQQASKPKSLSPCPLRT